MFAGADAESEDDSPSVPFDSLNMDLDAMFVQQSIQVVQTLDTSRLTATLKWLVDSANKAAKSASPDLETLLKTNADLREELDDLKIRQVGGKGFSHA